MLFRTIYEQFLKFFYSRYRFAGFFILIILLIAQQTFYKDYTKLVLNSKVFLIKNNFGNEHLPDPIIKILPKIRRSPTVFSILTYRNYTVTYQQVRIISNHCHKPVKVILPAGTYTIEYKSGTQYSQTKPRRSFSIQNKTNLLIEFNLKKKRRNLKQKALGNLNLKTTTNLRFFTQTSKDQKSTESQNFRGKYNFTDPKNCQNDRGEIVIIMYTFEQGCTPLFGLYQEGHDLEKNSLKEVNRKIIEQENIKNKQLASSKNIVKNGQSNCCKLCELTRHCISQQYSPQKQICYLKDEIREEKLSSNTQTVIGKKPSTIPQNTGIHKPNKLLIVSHPDDDAIFFGEGLKESQHEKYFNDFYIITVTLEYQDDRKMDQRQAMIYSKANYEMQGQKDVFCQTGQSCNPLKIGIVHDLADIISDRKQTNIVTHNKLGEYGHPYHVALHYTIVNLTAELCPEAQIQVFDPRPDDSDVGHLSQKRQNEMAEHRRRLLSPFKDKLLRHYASYVDRTVHYQFQLEKIVKIQDFNLNHSKHVCEKHGMGEGNICCENRCISQLEPMLNEVLQAKKH